MSYITKQLKRTLVLLAVATCSLAMHANITVSLSSVPLRKAMSEIEKVSNLHFFYKSSLKGLDSVVSLSADNEADAAVLDRLFSGTDLGYAIEDDGIVVVFPKASPMSRAEIEEANSGKSKASFAVRGTVIDTNDEPMIGATVRVKGSKTAVATDIDGNYTISPVHAGDELEITYVGYNPYIVKVKGEGRYDAVISENATALNEVVVVGYGTQKKVNLTGAVSVIKAEDINGRPSANAATALQGADPALNLSMSTGGPNSGYSIDIRGVASINGGTPLILVDGVEMTLNRVNANDIESVSILKDASAAAIYGAKASSGVVLITTKSGKEGKAKVSFDLKAGWKSPTTNTDFVDSGYWSVFINDWFMEEHVGYGYTTYDENDYAQLWMRLGKGETADLPWAVVQDDLSYKYYANFDWYNHYFKTTRPMQDYNISVTGGTDKVNYYISGRMYKEDGQIRQNNDNFKSYNLRSKIDVNITDWLKYGINVSYFESD